MTMNLLFIVLAVFLFPNIVNSSLTTEYYEKLISQITSEAEKYNIPESNAEFKTGFESTKTNDFGSFDFIIVGAGSAGSVLATRLSENEKWNILLLEAGEEENDFSMIPDMFMFLQFTEMNWGYLSTPQKTCCLGMKEKKCMVPRGKAIGGSGAINAVLYARGNRKDFDKWAKLGNPGWSYEEVLPYFIKSENSQINGDHGYHGKGGPLNVEHNMQSSKAWSIISDAAAELNISIVDINGEDQLGLSKNQMNIKHGKKESVGTAFLDKARKRKNLKIVTRALVTKINIDEESKVAQGVEFVLNDKKFNATAINEVILSGGAINSPQLLMISGIGPKNHLEEMKIKVIEDLPVGKNLQEHPRFPGLIFHTNDTQRNINLKNLIDEYLKGFGPLTNPLSIEGIGFIQVEDVSEKVPMIEYLFMPPSGSVPIPLQRVHNYDEELNSQYLSQLNPETDIFLLPILLHPKSAGQITLKSKSPIDFPNIDLNLFSEPEDIDNMIEGIEFILKLTKTEAFRKINANLVDIPICKNFEKYSKSFWECAIRHMSMGAYHPTGTTAMGPDRATSVVDNNLKVHGIEKLRVVDAGVFPATLSGHPNAAVIMTAEKISDIIKREYNPNFSPLSHMGREQVCYTI